MSGGSDSGKRKWLDADDMHELECLREKAANLHERMKKFTEEINTVPDPKQISDKQVITDKECHINRLRSRINELTAENQTLQTRMKEIEDENRQLKDENGQLTDENGQLKASLQQKEDDNHRLTNQIETVRRLVADVDNYLDF